jgi:hypothetical protein
MSSLTRQLQSLKSNQLDIPKISSKAKVSFLFDFKEAYKVDDEVVYTLCMKGIDELIKGTSDSQKYENAKLKGSLEFYREDIFHETAKDFYRGTQSKEVIEKVDSKLKDVITIISPYFMNPASHKIIEFLVRVYEVHSYHKHHLFFSFLPFYDTPHFLKLLQCMDLKNDLMMRYFEPFAAKGVKLTLDLVVRFMARENGAYLKVFSDIAFKFLTIAEDHDMYLNKPEEYGTGVLSSSLANLDLEHREDTVPHYRFWGTLVFSIISSQKASRSESFLYVIIPFIAKALDSGVKELSISALSVILGSLDVSQSEHKVPFSEEYMNAFLTEICKSASKSLSQNDDAVYFNLCIKTCLRILHAQQTIERLNEKLSILSYTQNSNKYERDQVQEQTEGKNKSIYCLAKSYKWVGDLLSNKAQFVEFIR